MTKDISVNGKRVHYIEAGDGSSRTVILLHGNIGDAAFHWGRIIPELAAHYHVIAPDLPDYGKSEPLSNPGFEETLAWLNELYKVLGLTEAALVGTSYGGLIARLFAAGYAHAVPALVLINGGSLPGKSSGFARVLAQTPLIGSAIFGSASRQMVGSRQKLQWFVQFPKTYQGGEDATPPDRYTAMQSDPLSPEMVETAQASAPSLARLMQTQMLSPVPDKRIPRIATLILWGEQDEISPLSTGKRIQKAIPGAELVPISSTHQAPHIEEPDIVAFQIVRFLDNLGKPQAPDLPGAGMLS
jgi:2-hydroxy-6-oxonona-2,4-dienedioate hydrolase